MSYVHPKREGDITGPKTDVLAFKKVFLNAKEEVRIQGLVQKDSALADEEARLRQKVGQAEVQIRDKERLIAIKEEALRDPSGIHPENRTWYIRTLQRDIGTLEREIAELRQQRTDEAAAISKNALAALEASIARKEEVLTLKAKASRNPELFHPDNRATLVSILNKEIQKLEGDVERQKREAWARKQAPPQLDSVLLRKQLDVVEAGRAEIAMYRQVLSKRPFLALDHLDPGVRSKLIGGGKLTEEQASAFVGQANTMFNGLPPQVQNWLYQTDPKSRAKDLIEPMLQAGNTKLMSLLVHNLAANPPQACRMELRQLVAVRLQGPSISSEIRDRLGAIRKRAQALQSTLKTARQAASEANVPEDWCSKLTGEYKDFLATLYCDTASEVGLDHYTLLGVGSMARDEMLPYSDIDYQTILDRKIDLYVYRAMEKIKEVEDYCNAMLAYLDEPKLDEMERPESVAGFFPEALAQAHAHKKMDIIQDAIVLASMSEIKLSRDTKRQTTKLVESDMEGIDPGLLEIVDEPGSIAEQYFASIKAIMKDPEARKASILPFIDAEADKFHPEKSDYMRRAKKDVKKGLLRMPIFCIRNLVFYYGLADAPKDLAGRCEALVNGGFMHLSVAEAVLFVAKFALNMRRKLHGIYKEEREDFCLKADAEKVKPADAKKVESAEAGKVEPAQVYVLDDEEDRDARKCIAINLDLFNRMKDLTRGCFLTFADLGIWQIVKRHPGGRILDCTAAAPTQPVVAAEMTIDVVTPVAVEQVGQNYQIQAGDSVTKLQLRRNGDAGMLLALVDQDLVNGQLKVDGKTIMLNTGTGEMPFMRPIG